MSLKIAVVADDPKLRQALRILLDRERDLIVVGEGAAADGGRVAALRPHVVVVDGDAHAGRAGAIAGARAGRGRARILMLTGRPSIDALEAAFVAGASGVADKMQPPRELLAAIRIVGRGGSYVCPNLATTAVASAGARARLTAREQVVYEQLVDGRPDEAVARELLVSLRAVRALRSRMLTKLGARSAVDLVRLAVDSPVRAG